MSGSKEKLDSSEVILIDEKTHTQTSKHNDRYTGNAQSAQSD